MSRLRRANIVELLKQIILENTEYTVAQLISTIMRSKNFSEEPYSANDIVFASVLENTLDELKKQKEDEKENQ